MEGRDIGTVVFPDAPIKVFLTASDAERARRRQLDEADADRTVAIDEVRAAVDREDALDSSRAVSPLRAAADALVIDTTGVNADTVIANIVDHVQPRKVGDRVLPDGMMVGAVPVGAPVPGADAGKRTFRAAATSWRRRTGR